MATEGICEAVVTYVSSIWVSDMTLHIVMNYLAFVLPPIQWVPGAIFLGLKRPGRGADHSPPSSVDVKE
jgi:hypothetical protein